MRATLLQNRWRPWALIGAIGLAFAAQYFYTGEFLTHFKDSNFWTWEPRYTLASALLLLAIGVAAWALAGPADEFADATLSSTQTAPTVDKTAHWVRLALGAYVASLAIYWVSGENLLVRLLWIVAAVALVVPLWRQATARLELTSMTWWQWAAVGGLTGLGFILRYWHLTQIPSHVDNDVALMGTFASRLIDSNNFNWIGASDSMHLLSYDQFLAWCMRLFGESHYGLVMHSVIMGTLTLPLVFFLGRDLFNWKVGLLAMAFLAIDYTHIQFSRILFGSTVTFLATLTFCLLFRGLKTGQANWFAGAGLAAGSSLLLYDSGRIIPVIAIALTTWLLFWQPTSFWVNLKNWCLFALGSLVGFGPMLAFAIKDFDSFMGRGNVVMLWSPEVWRHQAEAYQLTNVWDVVLEQARRTFLTFYLYGDGSPHFAFPRPMVAPLIAVLLAIGVGYFLWRLRDVRYFTLIAWIGLTFVLGGVLTYDPPYWPHLNIVLPAVAIIAAAAADKIFETLAPHPEHFGFLSVRLIGLGLVVFTGVTNWQAYTAYVADNAGPRIRLARYIDSLPPGYQVYLVSARVNWSEYAFQFFDRGVAGTDVTAEELEANPPKIDQPTLFVYMDQQDSIDRLRAIYPDGDFEEHFANGSSEDPVFDTLSVIPPNYTFASRPTPVNPATLPGWWLIAALMALPAVFWIRQRLRPKPVLVMPDDM